jgi:hypothetical protein
MHHRSTCNCFSKHLKENIIVSNVEINFVVVILLLWRTKRFCIFVVIGF